MEFVQENCVIGLEKIEKKKSFLIKHKLFFSIIFGTCFFIIVDIMLINDFISILNSL